MSDVSIINDSSWKSSSLSLCLIFSVSENRRGSGAFRVDGKLTLLHPLFATWETLNGEMGRWGVRDIGHFYFLSPFVNEKRTENMMKETMWAYIFRKCHTSIMVPLTNPKSPPLVLDIHHISWAWHVRYHRFFLKQLYKMTKGGIFWPDPTILNLSLDILMLSSPRPLRPPER